VLAREPQELPYRIQPEGFDDALSQDLAEGGDLGFSVHFHVVPEALGGKLARDHAQPTAQGGRATPFMV
jgi:hypothetical protein